MEVTAEILKSHLQYGASDNTAPQGIASSRALNYASGPSITRPDNVAISVLPYTLKYQGAVGLFGAENYFVKVKLNVDTSYARKDFTEKDWEPAVISGRNDNLDPFYTQAVIDYALDPSTVNTYDPAMLTTGILTKFDTYVSIDLANLKTGNMYVDNWLDVRLYTKSREEHPYDEMFVRQNDFFYIGFHARNTRRLSYNVSCLVGDKYLSEKEMTYEERQRIARS